MKQSKKTNKTNLNKANFRNKNAITLIALVVTIVVLLTLAGVSISLILDNNGIIAKSKYARLENRASQVEDEVGMWKQNNFINKESGQTQEEADTMLASLISRNLLKEDEIDRENEIITIKKNDGSILKQISYSKVTIKISKQPETEKSGTVLLTIDSVEGMTIPTITSEDELNEYIDSLSEAQKKEIIKIGYVKLVNLQDPTANCKTFEDVLKLISDDNKQEVTEEDFWTMVDVDAGGINGGLQQILNEAFGNEKTKRIEGYTVTNPDGETSNTYLATENGTYTFRVQDIVTGKTYTKKVEVTNIDENAKYYIVTVSEAAINNNTAKLTTKLASTKQLKLAKTYTTYWAVGLREKETNSLQTFTKAYIIYNNQKVDISSIIKEKNGYSYIIGGYDMENYLKEQIENFDWDESENSEYLFIIEKDGIYYVGNAKVGPVGK